MILTDAQRRKAIQLVQDLWMDAETHLTVHYAYVTALIDNEKNRIEVRVEADIPPGRSYLADHYWVHFDPNWTEEGGEVRITPVAQALDFGVYFPAGVYG